MELIEAGQKSYVNGQFDEALDLFNRALAAAKPRTDVDLAALVHIVGVHVKLGQLDSALYFAKAMVRRDRSDARGYLKCAQIERLNDDLDAAMKWYEHGIKNTKKDDKFRPKLKSSATTTKMQAAEHRVRSKPCDPMTVLPLEVARTVLGYLDYKEHTKLLRVSKSWKRLLVGLPPITNTLNLTTPKNPISHLALRAAVRRLRSYPTHLLVDKLHGPAVGYLQNRFELWARRPSLQTIHCVNGYLDISKLCLRDQPLVSLTLGEHALVSSTELKSILQHCHHLEVLMSCCIDNGVPAGLDFESSFRQERLLKLVVYSDLLVTSFACFPNLAHVELRGIRPAPSLTTLDFESNLKLRYLEVNGHNVHVLLPQHIETFEGSPSQNNSFVTFSAPQRCHLSSLKLRCWGDSLDKLVAILKTDALSHLRSLSIEFDHVRGVRQADIAYILGRCSILEHLGIKCYKMADSDLQGLVGTTPNLLSLSLEDVQITGAFLADLLKAKSCRIKMMLLLNCEKVSSDTWQWIMQRGIGLHVCRASGAVDLGCLPVRDAR